MFDNHTRDRCKKSVYIGRCIDIEFFFMPQCRYKPQKQHIALALIRKTEMFIRCDTNPVHTFVNRALAWDYFVAHAQKSVKWDHQCAWNVAVCFKQLKLSYCLVACVNLMKKTTFHLYSCWQSFDNVSNHNPWVETNTQLTGEIIFKLQKSWKEKVRLHQKQWNQYFHSNVL